MSARYLLTDHKKNYVPAVGFEPTPLSLLTSMNQDTLRPSSSTRARCTTTINYKKTIFFMRAIMYNLRVSLHTNVHFSFFIKSFL